MNLNLIELSEKLETLDRMITEEELEFLQKEYEQLLANEERKVRQDHKKVQRLHGMVCFLGAWGITKRDKRD